MPGRRVEVEAPSGERIVLEAEVVLLASGSRPKHLPEMSLDDPDVHVAWVGLTEEAAQSAGLEYETGRSSFGSNAKARISGFADGLIKLVFRAQDKVLVGVHIVGEVASELVHIGQFVMHEGGTIDRFIDATFAVPTRSEAYKYAAYDGLMRLERRRHAAAGVGH